MAKPGLEWVDRAQRYRFKTKKATKVLPMLTQQICLLHTKDKTEDTNSMMT